MTDGFDVVGLENDMRASVFRRGGVDARSLIALPSAIAEFRSLELDIRDREGVERDFARLAPKLEVIVHTAAQPSHDWAASDPHTDFSVNATGTLNLLEASRRHAPRPRSSSPRRTRCTATSQSAAAARGGDALELPSDHRYAAGIDASMSIDASTHSLFGVSKAAADLLVQEYGRYFDIPTVCFRGGCRPAPTTRARCCTASSPT